MDESNGYEKIADLYGKSRSLTGFSTIQSWAQTFPDNAVILDIGCGTGIPVTKLLLNEGLRVYAIDASPAMIDAFHKNFPDVPAICESVERSSFFNRSFDGIIAIGLLFLLPRETQQKLISKIAAALNPGGKLLFTAPAQEVEWNDVLTGQRSRSLGAKAYKELLITAGLPVIDELTDEGENHYFAASSVYNKTPEK